MKRALIAICTLAVLAGTAHADQVKALKKFFSDLTKDPDAAAKFVDGAEMVILPRADGIVMHPKTITVEDLLGDMTDATVTFKPKKFRDVSGYDTAVVVGEVDVIIKVGKQKEVDHLRVSAYMGGTEKPDDKLHAAMFSLAMPDKTAIAAAQAGTLPAPAAFTANGGEDLQSNFMKFDKNDFASMISDDLADKDATVLGSATGQTYIGKKGAKKIKAWKVSLAPDGPMYCGERFCAMNVKATMKAGGKDVSMTYRTIIYYWNAPEDSIVVCAVQFSLGQSQ